MTRQERARVDQEFRLMENAAGWIAADTMSIVGAGALLFIGVLIGLWLGGAI